jgi:hypothetical protein
MREIRQSGSVRGVRSNPYPYRDSPSLLLRRIRLRRRRRDLDRRRKLNPKSSHWLTSLFNKVGADIFGTTSWQYVSHTSSTLNYRLTCRRSLPSIFPDPRP